MMLYALVADDKPDGLADRLAIGRSTSSIWNRSAKS